MSANHAHEKVGVFAMFANNSDECSVVILLGMVMMGGGGIWGGVRLLVALRERSKQISIYRRNGRRDKATESTSPFPSEIRCPAALPPIAAAIL